ncbi:hypothetical protein BKA65DRAFT_513249 [Rhexocercosporidium sp. MPI-PUGE-AT-0058]|nr:hypothetical protein BKA65DRAFT_513249 [Rhexocercosporidium sp. MPI-PUGE-AT-0058]
MVAVLSHISHWPSLLISLLVLDCKVPIKSDPFQPTQPTSLPSSPRSHARDSIQTLHYYGIQTREGKASKAEVTATSQPSFPVTFIYLRVQAHNTSSHLTFAL